MHYSVGKYIILVIKVDIIFLKCIKQYRQHILCPAFLSFLGGGGRWRCGEGEEEGGANGEGPSHV